MPIKALDAARYLLYRFNDRGEHLTNLKLQKLLYYCQAWHLAHYSEPLFKEPVEAWVHGPVVASVFGEFKKYGWSLILEPIDITEFDISEADCRHIDSVIDAYGHLRATELEDLTHSEDPWRVARQNLAPDQPSRANIALAHMCTFYRQQLDNV
jgi:uncharacterized phage-associated protein